MAVTALKPAGKSGRPRTAKPHALLAALIAELPAAGTSWRASDRNAWLRMIAMAFNVVYQGAATEMATFNEPATAKAAPGDTPFVKMAPYAYWIDRDGVARGAGGKQILPSEVIGTLYDTRGEAGDLGAITWADGRTGISGMQLEIAAA